MAAASAGAVLLESGMLSSRRPWLIASVALVVGSAACSFDWDLYDPRLGTGASGAAGLTGGGGSGGATGGGGSGATGGGGSGATGGGGSGGVGACGTVDVLRDDFGDGVEPIGWEINISGDATIDETGGEMVLTLPADGSGGDVDARSARYCDMRNHRLFVEIPTMPNQAADAGGWFAFGRDSNNGVLFDQGDGTLYLTTVVDDEYTEIFSVPYDPATHRWWSFREEGGTLHFEVSADGQSFTTLASRSVALLFPMDSVSVGFGAWDNGTPNPGAFHLDNLQGGALPAESWCPMDSFSDDFDDGVESRAWTVREWGHPADCNVVEQNGQLELYHSGIDWEGCGTRLAPAYDLTDTSATIEVTDLPGATDPELYVWFMLAWDSGYAVELEVHDGVLRCNTYIDDNASTPAALPYVPADHRHWRLREQGGQTYWETSPDGSAWTTHLQMANPVPVTALDVELGMYCDDSCTPTTATFDNYNLAP